MQYLDDFGRAIKREDVDTVRRMVVAGHDVNAPCGTHPNTSGVTPLMIAASRGNTTLITLLLDAGAEINVKWPGEWSSLARAAASGSEGAVMLLLERGADADATFGHGTVADFVREQLG